MLLTELMDGITVLSKTEIYETPIAITIACTVALILAIILIPIFTCGEDVILRFIIVFICCVMSLIILYANRVPTGQCKYKVTIDNTVSMIEFYEKYEIVGQEGKIYTIRFME